MDEVLPVRGLDESAPTTGRKSARNRPIEVITRGERRRSWTAEQKREIVAESLGAELTPAEVARKYGIGSGQLYTWRQQLLAGPGTVIERAVPRFAAVDLAPPAIPGTSGPAPIGETAPPRPPALAQPGGMIEIVLPSGVSLRVDAAVDGRALRRVLDALDRR
jgi:transposase